MNPQIHKLFFFLLFTTLLSSCEINDYSSNDQNVENTQFYSTEFNSADAHLISIADAISRATTELQLDLDNGLEKSVRQIKILDCGEFQYCDHLINSNITFPTFDSDEITYITASEYQQLITTLYAEVQQQGSFDVEFFYYLEDDKVSWGALVMTIIAIVAVAN